jgi:tRNA(fMet)-specific endonuclease VapC
MSRLYVLDSDMLTLHEYGHPKVTLRVENPPPDDVVALTIISVEEQLSGWYKQIRQARTPAEVERAYMRLGQAVTSFGSLMILNYNLAAIARYEQLLGMKLNVRKMDLRIAAIVLVYNGILVTRNARDFQRVPGLTLEDWSQ